MKIFNTKNKIKFLKYNSYLKSHKISIIYLRLVKLYVKEQ